MDEEILKMLLRTLEQVRQKKISSEEFRSKARTIKMGNFEKKEGVMPKMTSLTQIIKVIQKINAACAEIDEMGAFVERDYQREKKHIEQKSTEMIEEMKSKYDAYKNSYFMVIRNEIKTLIDLLCQDYVDEWEKICTRTSESENLTFEENEIRLHSLLAKINEIVQKLNNINFDELVPPVKVEIKGESFITYTNDKTNAKYFNYNSSPMRCADDPKPIREIVKAIFPYCKML